MLLVTGGAGFIGSNIVAGLNEAGRTDVVVNDMLGTDGAGATCRSASSPMSCRRPTCRAGSTAASSTPSSIWARSPTPPPTDGDLVMETNFRLSLRLLDWCTATGTPFIYASSAATYGDGDQGFDDDGRPTRLRTLRPMNLYGWSKHLFDLALVDAQGPRREAAAAMGRA